jgi:hypothetical protein
MALLIQRNMARWASGVLIATIAMPLMVQLAWAKELSLFGDPLLVSGFATQTLALAAHDADYYDSVKGFQSFLTNLFGEGTYSPQPGVKIYAATKLTVDWAYQLNDGRNAWEDRLFAASNDRLNVDDKYWQILHEAHVTWSPGNFLARVGKQIVSWGQTDGIRLMDQINPLDQRRGFADVQFENTIIPIWLIRAEYYESVNLDWLQELGVQFVFNPNADFIRNQRVELGNNRGGLWAPNIEIPGPFPGGLARLGAANETLQQFDAFDPDAFEYGVKIEGMLYGAVVTLHGYWGREKDPVFRQTAPPGASVASDGILLLHLNQAGFFPTFRFVGGTFTREVPFLRIPIGGSPAPVLRLETFYAFDSTFATTLNTLEKHDDFRAAIGIDWKAIIPFLNPTAAFGISPQFFYRRIMAFPSTHGVLGASGPLEDDNYLISLFVNTSYYRARISPSAFWLHDITNRASFVKLQVAYAHTDNWRFTLGALLLGGEEKGKSFEVFSHKDQVFLTVEYRWH